MLPPFMGERIGAEFFAIPGLVVLAATLGLSFAFPSGTARLLHIGLRRGPNLPDVLAPFEELIFLAILLLASFFVVFVVAFVVLYSIERRIVYGLVHFSKFAVYGFFLLILGLCHPASLLSPGLESPPLGSNALSCPLPAPRRLLVPCAAGSVLSSDGAAIAALLAAWE
jgi:hypothetical protein